MPLLSFDGLSGAADARAPQIPVAVAGAADPTVLEALVIAQRQRWVSPILVGAAGDIRSTAARAGLNISGMSIVDASDAAGAAVAEVRAGRARMLMKGAIDTPALLRAMLHPETGLRTERTICQVVLMEIVDQQRRFLLADTGITIQPSLAQKADFVRSVIDTARALRESSPRVALLAATEKPNAAMPDTLESAELERRTRAPKSVG